ncbi:MAG TPA: TolC family protein [Candidatus Acidoferrales bacterium]|nr:TolC family protein [Candidatus Acidoferrales bacterium]
MNTRIKFLIAGVSFLGAWGTVRAQGSGPGPRRLTLPEAVQMALKHNHFVRIAAYKVEESEHAREAARSAYYPTVRNESRVFDVTDTQFIEIPAGALGAPAGTPIPERSLVLNQGGRTIVTSGTSLVQPLSQLFSKVKPANEMARAEVSATRANARATENEVALKVHQLYYGVLIAQLHRSATEARIKAAQELESERIQQVKFGSALDEELVASKAQTLQARQELLSTELQLSDLTMQLDDAIGLPLTMELALDPNVSGVRESCEREECVKIARESHPEVSAARAEVEKASAGVRLARSEYVPDVTAFARYSYQDNVPFLARNFGSFGGQLTYDLFDGGRRRAVVHAGEARLAQARENLARVAEEVELRVQIAYNKLKRTGEMVKVSEELLALRTESSRVAAQQLQNGAALRSQAESAVAQEFDARTLLLQSRLDYIQAHDEMTQAMGRTPE